MTTRVFRTLLVASFALVAFPAAAVFEHSDAVRSATVTVVCGSRLGSGVLINAEKGYVVTNGHIPIDFTTKERNDACTVTFPGPDFHLQTKYDATVVHAILDLEHDTDFAVLKLGAHRSGPTSALPQPLAASVDASIGDAIAAAGYPLSATQVMLTEGTILGLDRGIFIADAILEEGNSGGPAVDRNGDLIGISTRIRYRVGEDGEKEVVDFGSGDIAAFMSWLDTIDPLGHDEYVLHVPGDAYHERPYFIREATAGCDAVVRTTALPTVYCLRTGAHRASFPDVATYRSWYGDDFSDVQYITPENLTDYALTGLVTHKAGSLIKIQSDPSVYLVSDDIGTIRRIPDEMTAVQLFGSGWALQVRDVSEAFFPSYTVGKPLQ
jgi:hypothetical protein